MQLEPAAELKAAALRTGPALAGWFATIHFPSISDIAGLLTAIYCFVQALSMLPKAIEGLHDLIQRLRGKKVPPQAPSDGSGD